jgi:hypothetical protein
LLLIVIPAQAGIHFDLWITRRILRLALRAIGFADVRFGILPSQSGLRRNDGFKE